MPAPVFDVQGPTRGLLMTSGSVDQKNTYVFEVRPVGLGESNAKSLGYWSIGNGDDTMVTLWNPADEAQDLVFTLFFAGGHYDFPIHLGPRATNAFNVSEIVHSQIPDAEGNIVPASVHEGSARISGPLDPVEHILVGMAAGTYNVVKATCAVICYNCNGTVAFESLDPNPLAVGVSKTASATFTVGFTDGDQYNYTTLSTWTTSNSGVATVQSAGVIKGMAAGSFTTTATGPKETINSVCCSDAGSCPCIQLPVVGTDNGVVPPTITGIIPAQFVIGGPPATMSISGFGFSAFPSTPSVQFSGTGVTTSAASVINDGDVFADYAVSSSAPVGTQNVTVSFPGSDGGAAVVSNPWPVSIVQGMSVSGISPAQGLVGTAISVTISGSGFVTGASINAGSNISVTNVKVSASNQITATFTLTDSSSAGGNQSVTVASGGQTSSSLTFYAQVPSKMSMSNYEGLVLITNGNVLDYFGNVLASNECGGYRDIAYNLLDQKEGTILGGNFTLTESFSNYSTTVAGLTVPPPESSTQNTSIQTLADTQFFGTKAPSCPGSNDHESFNQSFSVTVGSTTYPLSTVNQITRGEYAGTFHVDVTVVTA